VSHGTVGVGVRAVHGAPLDDSPPAPIALAMAVIFGAASPSKHGPKTLEICRQFARDIS
jgi:hypothetical protein